MPPRRSRTENWRDSLRQLQERNGALEVSLPNPGGEDGGEGTSIRKNLIWRVRILAMSDTEIVIEKPVVMRQRIELAPGLELVGVIAIGPNRWMFRTKNLGSTTFALNSQTMLPAYRLVMPENVERCQRRNFYRVSTVGISVPEVACYPVIDPRTIGAAEAACRAAFLEAAGEAPEPTSEVIARIGPDPTSLLLPEVAPPGTAKLVNLGGGGVGLLLEQQEAKVFDRARHFWLRIDLTPGLPAALGVAARAAHLHIDSMHRTYAGMQFDFSTDKGHEQFIVTQVCRYVAELQREQLRRQSVVG